MKKALPVWLTMVSLGLAVASATSVSAQDCLGGIPDYIALGRKDMVLTTDAERILCRDDSGLPLWNGDIGLHDPAIVEDQEVRTDALLRALLAQKPIEFRRCVFREELLIHGNVGGGITFRECDFLGRVDIRNVVFSGPLEMRSSILHHGLHVLDAQLRERMLIEGSVLASPLEVERAEFQDGLVITGTRFTAGMIANGLRSRVGVLFKANRFLGTIQLTETEIAGSLRFSESEWNRGSLITLDRGMVGGGIRFDSCGFDASWKADVKAEDKTLIRLSDLTLGAPLSLTNATGFPRIRMSRSVVPMLMIPDWSIAQEMVLLGPEERGRGLRATEEQGEVLQLLQKSYEAQGRTRDSISVNNTQRRVLAEIKGGPTLWIRIAADWFGTGVWWFLGWVLLFTGVIFAHAVTWEISAANERLYTRAYRALDLSVKTFFSGPPEDKPLPSTAMWVLR
ncbi:MAG: hypothetical protein ACREA0_04990, partial [bacterium]